MFETRACGVLVFRKKPELSFLLMKHPNRLDLPKGHMDEGETELQSALRELKEETGIRRGDIDLDPDFKFTIQYTVNYKKKFGGQSALKTVVIFLGLLNRDVRIKVSEHPDYRWITWSPPHAIQAQTIDPLLAEVERHWEQR
jgi:bis(5'-nucleosidyl)-tetraphosphatase